MKNLSTNLPLMLLALSAGTGWTQDLATTNKKPVIAIAVIHPTQGHTRTIDSKKTQSSANPSSCTKKRMM